MKRVLWVIGLVGCGGTCPEVAPVRGFLGQCCFPGQSAGVLGGCEGPIGGCVPPFEARDGTCHPPELSGLELVTTPPGTFSMGCDVAMGERCGPDESPMHDVRLSRGLAAMTTEVTQGQYRALTGESPSRLKSCEGCPVESVSWEEAARFANLLSRWEGLMPAYEKVADEWVWNPEAPGYRLPTEAEWEYLARSGGRELYAGSNTLAEVGWSLSSGLGGVQPVGQLKPNGWGLYDMTGNAWEWVQDGPRPYTLDPVLDPVGESTGMRVVRGGSWSDGAFQHRVPYRAWVPAEHRDANVGFRLVRWSSSEAGERLRPTPWGATP